MSLHPLSKEALKEETNDQKKTKLKKCTKNRQVAIRSSIYTVVSFGIETLDCLIICLHFAGHVQRKGWTKVIK